MKERRNRLVKQPTNVNEMMDSAQPIDLGFEDEMNAEDQQLQANLSIINQVFVCDLLCDERSWRRRRILKLLPLLYVIICHFLWNH